MGACIRKSLYIGSLILLIRLLSLKLKLEEDNMDGVIRPISVPRPEPIFVPKRLPRQPKPVPRPVFAI